jgi:hypothetical protein
MPVDGNAELWDASRVLGGRLIAKRSGPKRAPTWSARNGQFAEREEG